MLMQHLQPKLPSPLRRNTLRVDADAAYLSGKLRELALRAYQSVWKPDNVRSGSACAARSIGDSRRRRDWTDLHSQIVQLERAFDAQHLDSLAAYVGALREKVESRLV